MLNDVSKPGKLAAQPYLARVAREIVHDDLEARLVHLKLRAHHGSTKPHGSA